jgi:D-alanyl-D-alanine carboxypeptidase
MSGIGRRIRGCGGAFSRAVMCAALLAVAVLIARPAIAQVGSDRYASIVVDAATGAVISSSAANEPRYPASLTKLMTLYLTFEALRDRRITLDTLVPVSAHAASMVPSKLGLVPGTKLTVQQAIFALVTKSANDAAAALGELLGGSEPRFGQMMTLRARALGMRNTTFRNASGLPDPQQTTTAYDLAILARHLINDFPDQYHYFSTPEFVWHGRTIMNHDSMLRSYPGADGMKTGYTNAAGHNLITSAVHGNVRLIGVVLGARSNYERDVHMTALLNQGFDREGAGTAVADARAPGLLSTAHADTLPANLAPRPVSYRTEMPHPAARPTAPYGVQVGVFLTEAQARRAAASARSLADRGDEHIERITIKGRAHWRAQLTGLTSPVARGTCAALARRHSPCMVITAEHAGQVASR